MNPAVRPTPRYAHCMTYDSRRGVVVLFGGNVAGGTTVPPTYVNETWEYNGVTWTQRTFAVAPPARGTGTMVFDSARGVCVLFGGQDNQGTRGDLWEYDGNTWTPRTAPGPAPTRRVSHFMGYDSHRGVSIIHSGWGGNVVPGALLNDTWEWDGVSWRQIITPVTPLPRVSGGSAFDDQRGRFIIFAGGGDFRATAETWEYDGANWVLRFNNVAFWRITPGMCYDSARGVTFAYGGILGNIRYADEFEWNGITWTNADIPGPNGRSDPALVYDSQRMRCVLFGGESQQPARLNDTWELRNLNPITIVSSPLDATVDTGQSATFSVAATGNVTGYQWRFNRMNIPGATGTQLSVVGVPGATAGLYDVLVSNACGTRASAAARLTVLGGICPADINGDGYVDPDDLADFIAYFFGGTDPRADFNGDGSVDPDDMAEFITAFFQAC